VIVAVPDLDGSWLLTAFTVAVTADEGAVKRPAAEIVPPPDTDQVTAELKLPVPVTFALHCEVAPVATAAGEQVGETEEMAGEVAWGAVVPAEPPQETTSEKTRQASKQRSSRVVTGVPRLLLGYLQTGRSCLLPSHKKVICPGVTA
jgi:hypothetical protein